MSEILLLINIDDDKKIDIEDIEQSLTNDFENIGEVKRIDRDKLKKFFNQFENLLEVYEKFNTKVDDINRFKEPINSEKWDYLDHYYMEPLNYEIEQASENFYSFMED